MCSNSSCITSRVCATSDANGSSISKIFGSMTSARKVHALLHAARELVGIMMLEAGKADHLDEMRRALLGLARADVEALQSIADIVEHRPPRQQRGILEHDRAVGPRLRHHAAVDQDAARFCG